MGPAALPRQRTVRALREDGEILVRLVPAGEERLVAAWGGFGIVLVNRADAPADRLLLGELARRFGGAALPAPDPSLEAATERLEEAAERAGAEGRLGATRLYGPALPPPTWRPEDDGIALRPADIEITALEAGLRDVVKLEQAPAPVEDSIMRATAERGLCSRPLHAARHGPRTLLVARDGAVLEHAAEVESLLLEGSRSREYDTASAEMGRLLGYPACCVQRFGELASQDDTSLAWALLPALPSAAPSALTQWLHPSLSLLSHAPCSLQCGPTERYGRELLDLLSKRDTSFSDRYFRYAARLHVVDHEGRRLALSVRSVDSATMAVEEQSGVSLGRAGTGRTPDLTGSAVHVVDGGLVHAASGWFAPYVADHRRGLR